MKAIKIKIFIPFGEKKLYFRNTMIKYQYLSSLKTYLSKSGYMSFESSLGNC